MEAKVMDLGKASLKTQGAPTGSADSVIGSDPHTTHTPGE